MSRPFDHQSKVAHCLALILLALTWLAGGANCQADTIYLKDGSVLHGRVMNDGRDAVKFQVRINPNSTNTGDGPMYRLRTVLRTDIVTIAKTVEPELLAALDPTSPKSYRDLAEQVAKQLRDPESHDLAVRLFLLAAYHSEKTPDDRLQQYCFRKLIEIARNENERKRVQALAHIKQPTAGKDWFSLYNSVDRDVVQNQQEDLPEQLTPEQVARHKELEQQNRSLLKAVRLIRLGTTDEANSIINQPWARESMNRFADTCDWFQLREIIASRSIAVQQLAKLVELEIRLTNLLNEKDQPESTDWSMMLSRKVDSKTAAARIVRFASVSEFDLTKCLYREGQWVAESSNVLGK